KDGIFSPYKGLVRSIEFQKHGLPHCQILLFLDQDSKFSTPEKIDKVACAEIPDLDQEPKLYAIVTKFMMHGPCGELNLEAPCMKMDKRTGKMKCSKGSRRHFSLKQRSMKTGTRCIEGEMMVGKLRSTSRVEALSI